MTYMHAQISGHQSLLPLMHGAVCMHTTESTLCSAAGSTVLLAILLPRTVLPRTVLARTVL